MDPTVPSTDALLTFGGLSIWTTAIVEVILRAWRPDPDTQDRFGPLLAYAVAILSAVAVAVYLHADPVLGAITGVMVGWASMGVHDTAKAATG